MPIQFAGVAVRRALISVYDKHNIEKLAGTLISKGWQIISSGGTHKYLSKFNVPCTPIEEFTGNPEIFDGRIKTISFSIEAGILFDRANTNHIKEAKKFGVKPIDMVVCNFYPFAETVKNTKDEKQIIEMIDVGGPAMIRAAAKNNSSVICVVCAEDYEQIIEFINKDKEIPATLRRNLAAKAFKYLVDYDKHIENYLNGKKRKIEITEDRPLRYGENPHQKGFWCESHTEDPLKLSNFCKHNGKELSFNNYLDMDAALNALCLIGKEKPASAVIKHTNPCGAARGLNISEAFLKAWDGDALAAFGGIVAVNRNVDQTLAENMISGGRFFEVLMAPLFTIEALNILCQKKNLIILSNPALSKPKTFEGMEIKTVRGGYLMQEKNIRQVRKEDLVFVTDKKPEDTEIEDMLFAWDLCSVAKSNTITIAKNKQLLGVGAGAQDRVTACKIACEKAGKRAASAVAASDAFFPFPDGPQILIKAGVRAIIQPGGSIRDEQTIDLCNERGVAMAFTGVRGFKH